MAVRYQLLNALIRWLGRSNPPYVTPLCDFDRIRHQLTPCDVVLVEGRSRADNTLKTVSGSAWSHAALYIGRLIDLEDNELRTQITNHYQFEPDTPLIIETRLGQGTIVSPLLSIEQEHIRICRPKGLATKDARQVLRYAISRIGRHTDILKPLDLLRFFVSWSLIPHRWRLGLFRYSAGKHTKIASATLLAEAFDFIQFPILPLVKKTGNNGVQLFRRRPKLCFPIDFDQSPYFEIVKYPFIDFASHSKAELLPWKGNGVVSGVATQHLSHAHPPKLTSIKPIARNVISKSKDDR